MKNESKHCYGCRFYKPYYTKGYRQFEKCDIGLCGQSKSTVDKHDSCEKYFCTYHARIDYKKATLAAITEHVNVLAEIKQILEEDDEEAVEELLYNFKNRKKIH